MREINGRDKCNFFVIYFIKKKRGRKKKEFTECFMVEEGKKI